jgi:hypothetical protein
VDDRCLDVESALGGGPQSLSGAVAEPSNAVDDVREAQHVGLLALASDAVCSPEIEGIGEFPIDGLGVVPPAIKPGKIRVREWDCPGGQPRTNGSGC